MQLDIRDESAGGDIVLSLFVENERFGTARASADVLDQMQQQLKCKREDVEADLRKALADLANKELAKVTLGAVEEVPPRLRFVARYVYRDHRDISEGLVWYDVAAGETGPEEVPSLVRNRLRYAVHEQLAAGNANAERLLKVFR
jgi:hypothetical protein